MTEQMIELGVEECEAVAGGGGYMGASNATGAPPADDRSGYLVAGH
jgi:hypothetical protein